MQAEHRRCDADLRDRREVLDRIVRHLGVETGIDRMRRHRCDEQRVAVGRRLRDHVGADIAARADLVLDEELLVEQLRELGGEDASRRCRSVRRPRRTPRCGPVWTDTDRPPCPLRRSAPGPQRVPQSWAVASQACFECHDARRALLFPCAAILPPSQVRTWLPQRSPGQDCAPAKPLGRGVRRRRGWMSGRLPDNSTLNKHMRIARARHHRLRPRGEWDRAISGSTRSVRAAPIGDIMPSGSSPRMTRSGETQHVHPVPRTAEPFRFATQFPERCGGDRRHRLGAQSVRSASRTGA